MISTATKTEWKDTTLGEVATRITKGTTPTTLGFDFVETGVNFIKVESITDDGKLLSSKFAHIADETHTALSRSILQEDDILFSIAGAIGRSALVPKEVLPANVNQAVAIVRPNKEKILPRFLAFLLLNKEVIRFTNSIVAQSVQANINLQQLSDLEISLPSTKQQQEITAILGCIDDKIELLKNQNETLEQTAQAIFNEWFVKPITNGNLPDEWKMGTLGDVLDVKGGTTPSTRNAEYWDGDIHWTTPKDLSDRRDAFLLDTNSRITEKGLARIGSGLLPVGTLLLSSRAPIGYIAITAIPLAINQGYIAINSRGAWNNHFTFLWLKANMSLVLSAANGSTFMEISKGSFRTIETPLPPTELLESFSKGVSPMFEKILSNIRSIKSLSSIRDALLPRLMSGEIKV